MIYAVFTRGIFHELSCVRDMRLCQHWGGEKCSLYGLKVTCGTIKPKLDGLLPGKSMF